MTFQLATAGRHFHLVVILIGTCHYSLINHLSKSQRDQVGHSFKDAKHFILLFYLSGQTLCHLHLLELLFDTKRLQIHQYQAIFVTRHPIPICISPLYNRHILSHTSGRHYHFWTRSHTIQSITLSLKIELRDRLCFLTGLNSLVKCVIFLLSVRRLKVTCVCHIWDLFY